MRGFRGGRPLSDGTKEEQSLLADWPIGRQSNWLEWVNQAETEKELESLRQSVQRGRPFGDPLGKNRSPNGSDSNPLIDRSAARRKSHNAAPADKSVVLTA